MNKNKKLILDVINQRKTLIGIGPMSKNSTDACIELSDTYDVPMMLIPSRRQVDSKFLGGGYANNWSTEDFSKYVNKKSIKKKVLLCRDHGGPWQNNVEIEKKLDLSKAMASAKSSFENDIDSNFQILHIDPSIDIFQSLNIDIILERIYELYEHCYDYAKKKNKDILFEIGTEEQSGSTSTFEEIEFFLEKLNIFYIKKKLPKATFVVIQCGTKVVETRNIGSFESPLRIIDEVPVEIQLPKTIDICKKYDVLMKEHNGDYLSDESLLWHPRLGIHAVNVAPEFGVAETKSLINILKNTDSKDLLEQFLYISYSSKKWKKWLVKDSKISDYEKSIIAGHYVMSDPEVIELKKKANSKIKDSRNDIDRILQSDIKKSIKRYMYYFRLIKNLN